MTTAKDVGKESMEAHGTRKGRGRNEDDCVETKDEAIGAGKSNGRRCKADDTKAGTEKKVDFEAAEHFVEGEVQERKLVYVYQMDSLACTRRVTAA